MLNSQKDNGENIGGVNLVELLLLLLLYILTFNVLGKNDNLLFPYKLLYYQKSLIYCYNILNDENDNDEYFIFYGIIT